MRINDHHKGYTLYVSSKTDLVALIREIMKDEVGNAMEVTEEVQENDFNEKKQNIEIAMTLDITEADLHQLHNRGIASSYKRYELWEQDFCEKMPSFSDGQLEFICVINHNGKEYEKEYL